MSSLCNYRDKEINIHDAIGVFSLVRDSVFNGVDFHELPEKGRRGQSPATRHETSAGRYRDNSTRKKGKPSMMKSVLSLMGSPIASAEGGIGSLEDFYINTSTWKIEFAAVEKAENDSYGMKMIPTDRLFYSKDGGFFCNSVEEGSAPCLAAQSEMGPSGIPPEDIDTRLRSLGEMAAKRITFDEGRTGSIDDLIVDLIGWKVARIAVVGTEIGKTFERTLIAPEGVIRMDK
jgi:hypothetical protein